MTSIKTTALQDVEIVELIKTTDMTCADIGKRFGISGSAVTRRGVKAGVNMVERSHRVGGHKNRKARKRDVLSVVPDTMTGDGLSLKWLSKEWKPCTVSSATQN
jgi:hypothetical protein